ncbi:hypothetical protein SAMN02910418_01764 [Bowdeniella nasicola]|uniref:DUF4175 domain-containing protein n=1 Tax=Bowdeniella nasicola TaxID=208480 RepID=A0A1H4BTI2_9ACTO|nr:MULTISPECIES: hypothetical protein [Bowdeniella]SEA51142.1 hypothetical protein SAMN02910418_01764 [Bowdeniella nasicola]
MYGAIWRILPGPTWLRAILALLLLAAVIYVLFEFVFPVIEPYMPFQQDAVDIE